MGFRSDHVLHSAADRLDESNDSTSADVPRILGLAARTNLCPAPPVSHHRIETTQVSITGGGAVDPVDLGADIEDNFENDPAFGHAMEAAYNAQLPRGVCAGRGQGSEKPANVFCPAGMRWPRESGGQAGEITGSAAGFLSGSQCGA
jgi:hypothetical protein